MYLRGYPSHHDSQETTRQLQSGIVPGTTTCTRLAATEPIDRFRYITVGASSRCSEMIEREGLLRRLTSVGGSIVVLKGEHVVVVSVGTAVRNERVRNDRERGSETIEREGQKR